MADQKTTNVSLTPHLQRFAASQVQSGRYRSVSEVVRAGLRRLERDEQHRLLETWLLKGLTGEEIAQLPPQMIEQAAEHMRSLVERGAASARSGNVNDGEQAMARIRQRLMDQSERGG